MMKRAVVCLFAVSLFAALAPAQTAKPYQNGGVWEIQFIHAKAGMEDRYLRYLSTDWKREQETLKKSGMTLDYKVIRTDSHNPNDFNIILMTQYKDLATMEANADKSEAMLQQQFGGQDKVEAGYQDRASYRDIVGGRLGREIILEPKK
jgi:hypothetical protein